MTATALVPGSVIGILGGGQLGRMLALAAAELGFRCHIFTPEPDGPAASVSTGSTVADWANEEMLERFASQVDVITYEFENVPLAAVEALAARRPVYPPPAALAVAQDRLREKDLATSLGLGTAPYAAVNSVKTLEEAIARVGLPAILKTRRLGYDGKGQVRIAKDTDAEAAWRSLGGVPCILEGFVAFEREVSVVLARGRDGAVAAYDIPENRHEAGILRTSSVPAAISPELASEAVSIGTRLATALDYVGILAVELFVTGGPSPRLLVNEIAPRVHNSGHWTQDACLVSQFEQHIRAIAGWPLGNTARHSDVEMTNLLGADAANWARLAAEPSARVHLYGKAEARAGRKMGHVNRLRPRSLL